MPNAIIFYKISRWFYEYKLELFSKIIQGLIFLLYNCNISYKANIGKQTEFLHKGMATLILDFVEIGENCRIGMNVLIVGKGPYKNVAKIKNNVWISPGSIIVGPVIIEDNVIISPNSVVYKSIPQGKIVAGNPAKIIGCVNDLDYDIFKNESYKEGYMPYLVDCKHSN